MSNLNLPEGSRGRILAVGLLLIPLLLLGKHLVMPAWSSYAEINEEIDDAHFELQRYQRVAATLPKLRKQHQELSRINPLEGHLLLGKNRALAAAAL